MSSAPAGSLAMRRLRRLLAALLLLAFPVLAMAGAGLQRAGNDLGDQASLQRGARLYVNYCAACHSLQYLRYSRLAEDLGLSEEEVMQNLDFTGAGFGETLQAPLPADAPARWFGSAPPDLSLVGRVRGSDWVYTYLKSFHLDESQPLGWNNTLLANTAMPNPLWELQGIQQAEYGEADPLTGQRPVQRFTLARPGRQDAVAFSQTVRDITNFLAYAAEPAALKREKIGTWVLLFLAALTLLAWLLKEDYWRDVK